MLSRANLIGVAALAALIAIDVATVPEPPSELVGAPLFPALEPARAEVITVGGDVGGSLRIERVDGEWVLPAWENFPADEWLVDELLGALERQSDRTLVARAPTDPEAFGLGAVAGPEVAVLGAGGAQLAAYVQGGDLPRGPGASTGLHLVRAGESAVYRAPLLPRLTIDPQAWMSTRVLELPAAAVLGLRIRFAGQRELEFRRDADGQWSAPVGDAPTVPLDRLVTSMGSLFHSGLAQVEDRVLAGLEPPVLELAAVLAGEDGQEIERSIAIGGDDPEGASYATSPQWPRPWIVVISEPMLLELLESVQSVVARATFPDDGAAAPGDGTEDGE